MAALLASPEILLSRFRVLCGFSPRMQESCWYDTNLNTLWRYLKHRLRNVVDKEADIEHALSTVVAARTSGDVGAGSKPVASAKPELRANDAVR